MNLREEDFPRLLSGRLVTRDDLEIVRRIITENPTATRMHISREVCLAWKWYKPDGGLKEMCARSLLLNLHKAGLIELPPPRPTGNNHCKFSLRTPAGEPGDPIVKSVQELLPLRLERVTAKKDSSLWNELVDRYHYLGYTRLPGAQIRYLVYGKESLIAVLGFSAAAWSVKDRDLWIGWNLEQRRQNLVSGGRQFPLFGPALG